MGPRTTPKKRKPKVDRRTTHRAPKVSAAELRRDQDRINLLKAQSPLADGVAKDALCLGFVTAERQIDDIRRKIMQGVITGEEHKALSGALSNLKRIGQELHVTKPVEKGLGAL